MTQSSADKLPDLAAVAGRLPVEPLDPAIRSIQPGGGVCLRIELGWGRFRRWYLKLLRPGYVARMAACRRGGEPLPSRGARSAGSQVLSQPGRLPVGPGGRSVRLAGSVAGGPGRPGRVAADGWAVPGRHRPAGGAVLAGLLGPGPAGSVHPVVLPQSPAVGAGGAGLGGGSGRRQSGPDRGTPARRIHRRAGGRHRHFPQRLQRAHQSLAGRRPGHRLDLSARQVPERTAGRFGARTSRWPSAWRKIALRTAG